MAVYKHNHTHFTCTNLEKALGFYTGVLGAKLIKDQVDFGRRLIDIELGGVPIRISNSTGADDNWKGPKFGLHHFALNVDDLDKAAAAMKSFGIEFVIKPSQARPGLRFAFVTAPDNVLIELLEQK